MPTYGRVKVDTITYDLSGTATDVSVSNIATKASPTFTGTVTVPTPTAGDNSTKAASTAFVATSFAPLASPTFTGSPTVPGYAALTGATFTGTVNGTSLVLSADLTVNGTTTTINTTTLQVEDKNIEIGKVSTPSDATADGGGLTLLGATNKTFNWVDSTDAWTSSEHLHLGDNKKLFLGTGQDYFGVHDGNNTYLRNATGAFNIQQYANATLDVYSNHDVRLRVNGGELAVDCSMNGSVDLYHNNNKKLETTSSGINVTGQINVNGSALSAAPEITGTASGAIASEKSLIVNTNGTLSEVSTIAATVGNPDTSQTGNTQEYHRLLYWEGNKYIYGRKHGSTGTLKIQVITVNADNSLTFGSELDYGTVSNNYMEPWSMILNYDKDTLYTLQQYNTSGYMNFAINSVSGTTISAASANGIVNNSGPMGNMAQFKQANGTISFFYKRGQNSTMAYRGMNNSGVNSGPNTMHTSVNNSWGNFTSCYIPWLDKNLMFYRNSSAEGFIRMVNMNSSAGYSSMGSSYQIASGGWGDNSSNTWSKATPSFAVDTVNQRVAFFYLKNNAQGDNGIHYRILTNIQSGGSITVGAKQTVTTSTGTAIHADYDSANNQFVMVWNDTSDSDKGKMFKGTSASPALTNTSTTTFQSASDIYDETDRNMAFAMGSNNGSQGLIAFSNNSNNNTRNFQVYNGESTNLTSENFVGFAKSGVSNGQSVTAKVTGNTSTQSSLTAGQKYYVQKDGTLGLSPVSGTSVEAGLALTSSSLLIKG